MADATVKVVSAASIAHVTNGGAVAAGAFSVSSNIVNNVVGSANASGYPRADVVLTIIPTATTSSTAMNLYLYRRDLNIGASTGDMGEPTTLHSTKFMGAEQMSGTAAAGTHVMVFSDIPLPSPGDCQFFINNGLTPTLPTGWTMTVIPKSDVGATT